MLQKRLTLIFIGNKHHSYRPRESSYEPYPSEFKDDQNIYFCLLEVLKLSSISVIKNSDILYFLI